MRIDLHTHSRASDGTDRPAALVRAAVDAGLDVVAITDHDTADGWAEAGAAAVELGIELVPGMEISTIHRGRSVHLLAYLPDPTYPPLAGELTQVLTGRGSRVPAMLQQLHRHGIEITEDDVRRASDGTAAPGRPHIADALVTLGVVADRTEAFNAYLGAGKVAYVDRYAAPLEAAIRHVTDAGGVAVIAHPWGRGGLGRPDEETLAALHEIGLAGIEVDHQDHDPATRERLRAIARNLGLVATGSSDYHGVGKTDHELGCNTTAPEEYARLMELARAAAAGSDRVTPVPVVPPDL
ncbi:MULTISPECIES: PHP domain-containing protein [unclassified Nocardioides]|uniref:PHP domain-containing protein n=1 Tax=unclassified Nocardioides TaxID=2615069 RepID=UPI0009F1584D|nr:MULTISPECIES: PHP domain-containing protein [unclassified Nocardioides]GAW51905.1 phosphotransferase domain-containing protein [Nocardioides sp. PD653-B2]GAW57270.1 phosphotransferase domain-containing protein [Nocardioides sp. PD653]